MTATGARILGLLAILILGLTEAIAAECATWRRLADMPTARLAAGAVGLDGKIYVIGGCRVQEGQVVAVAEVEEYTPETDTWRKRAPLPSARGNIGIAVALGRIFVIGGTATDRTADTDEVDAYDPATDRWSVMAPMPTPRCQLGAVAVDGKIYAIGGNQGHEHAFERYDPAADRWSVLPRLPKPRRDAGVAVLEGRIHVSGGLGYDGRYPVDLFQIYDPASALWTEKTPTREARCDSALVPVGAALFAVGGYHRGPVAAVETYDPAQDAWRPGPELPSATQFHCAITLGGKIFVFGGSHRLPSAISEAYVLSPPDAR